MYSLPPIYIFDIDGTLCDIRHRLHFIYAEKQDWNAFHFACKDDQPIWPVIATMERLRNSGAQVLLFSGRSDIVRKQTADWLSQYTSFGYEELLEENGRLSMRKEGDFTEDQVLKEQWLKNMLQVDRERIVGAFDDRQRVVDMWRANGIVCFQCAPGDF